jgi:two-component system, chemotaxis family, chemotaxis protein CheY
MPMNILIVDDSSVMRQMILKVLGMTGLEIGEVYQAADGRAGLAALAEHWIDLVFADINMPVMKGEEMIDKMREDPATRDTPVVVVSTEASRPRIHRLEGGGIRFVRKPFTPETMRRIIEELVGVHDEKQA